MASKRAISYKWRFFLPVVLSFWAIVISMAAWQVYRVRQEKLNMIYDQLEFCGERVAVYYDRKEFERAEDFMKFTNKFYGKSLRYDPISIIIYDNDGHLVYNIGDIIPNQSLLPDSTQTEGIMTIESKYLTDYDNDQKYIYGVSSSKGETIYSLLPYSRVIAKAISSNTFSFWTILFGLSVIVTIIAYITTLVLSRNIMVLRDFARAASSDPHWVTKDANSFPHDELGDISRQIVELYNQRVKEMERRDREHAMALHAIEEKNRVKKELTSNISHELKTPAGVIQGYLDTIVDNADMDADTKEMFIYKAWESAHRLTSLIADITAITKLENGGKLVNVTDVNMHELAYKFNNELEDSHILPDNMTFTYDVPLTCVVKGNESLLNAVLTNFTKNAAVYSQGTECHFEMMGEDDNFYHFRYYDNGVGVPPEHLANLFERFYRVNSGRSRKAGGTGLGLSIVEVTITSLGGKISVANRYPAGLEFLFSLPKYQKRVVKPVEDKADGEEKDVMGDLT